MESVEVLVAELHREAERHRAAGYTTMTFRAASAADGPALERLAQLDSAEVPGGEILLAEKHGELVAALSLDGGQAIVDPFRETAEVVRLLELRAGQPRAVER